MLKDMYDFGVPELDEALGGGLKDGSVAILEDEIGVFSDILLSYFIARGLRRGDDVIVLLTEHPVQYYVNMINILGVRADVAMEVGKLIFVDAFLSPFTVGRALHKTKFAIRNVGSLSDIRQTLQAAIQSLGETSRIRIVIDSLSQLLPPMTQSPQPAAIFLQQQHVERSERGGVLLGLVHGDGHLLHIVRSIEYIADIVLSMRFSETDKSKREVYLRVLKTNDPLLFEKLQNRMFICSYKQNRLLIHERDKIVI
ncbi:MAG: RAD55 family ATPase [Candidatus Baldrarchaeia archaeon]